MVTIQRRIHSELLDDKDHQQYQMLIGMLNWIVCIGIMEVAYATASLYRFTACPRKGHRDRALRIFGYLKKYKNRRIVIDSRDTIRVGGKDALNLDSAIFLRKFTLILQRRSMGRFLNPRLTIWRSLRSLIWITRMIF